MLSVLLGAEQHAGWKRIEPTVKRWQTERELVADGKFGPKSGLTLALEAGTIPIVRYWPATDGRNPEAALADYRAGLEEIAISSPRSRAELLAVSAARETGQSFGAPTGNGGKFAVQEQFGAAA
jgi:hypothetical protein